MPPKKDAPRAAEEEEPDEDEKELVEKELVISYIKSRLGRYQDMGSYLLAENKKLEDELAVQSVNLRDINEFLTNELKSRSATNAKLQESLTALNEEKEAVNTSHQEMMDSIRKAIQTEMDGMLERMAEMESKYNSSLEFLDQREELMGQMKASEEELANTRTMYKKRIGSLEKKHINEKDKWRKEMDRRIKDTKAYMMKLTDNQLEMTTKRTIMENEQMSGELQYQSRQTEKLSVHNSVLESENGELEKKLQGSLEAETELAKRNHVYQRTIKSLLEKLCTETEQAQLPMQLRELQKVVKGLSGNLCVAQLQLKERDSAIRAQGLKLEDRQQAAAEKQAQHDETVWFLQACLADIEPTETQALETTGVDAGADGARSEAGAAGRTAAADPDASSAAEDELQDAPSTLADLDAGQRRRVLEYLLEKVQGCRPEPSVDEAGGAERSGRAERSGSNPLASTFLTQSGNPSLPKRISFSATTSRAASRGADLEEAALENRVASVSVQTEVQGLPPAYKLMHKLTSELRPWGGKATDHALKPNGGPHIFLRRKLR